MRTQFTAQAATTRAARRLMHERGWSQKDMAAALGVPSATLRNRLYGRRKWTVEDLQDLRALGAQVPAWEVES